MSLKTKIYIFITIILVGYMTYQYFSIRNLKDRLHNSVMEISVLEQNQQALKDSIAFKPDSVAILHTFIKDKDELNKSLEKMYNNIKDTSDNNIKKLQSQIGLLEGEITFKDKVIDDLLVEVNTDVTDSTIRVPVLYHNIDMGLKIDAYTVGNFVEKTAYVHWNEIKVTLPKLRIGLVYESKDSTIVAMVQANDKMQSFKTVMSDDLYKLIVNNSLPQKTWMDYFWVNGEFLYNNEEPFVNLAVGGEYKNYYLKAGKSFDVFDKFSNNTYYIFGVKYSLKDITSKF